MNKNEMMRRQILVSRLSSVGLVLVLTVLTAFAVAAALTGQRMTTAARTDVTVNELYQQAHYSVGAEESLERKYRLEPSPEVFASHRAAADALKVALKSIRRQGDAHDRSVVRGLLAAHLKYLAATKQMFDAVDAHQSDRVVFLDSHVVDPVFGQIEETVDREASGRHHEALRSMAMLDVTQRRIVSETPWVFACGILLIGTLLFVLRGVMAGALRQTQSKLSEAEQQLVQAAKLASLGTLSAGVAHELNQPIAIIRGITQQLQDEPGLSADVLADLQLVEGQTGRMVKIVNHLRSFSRVGGPQRDALDVDEVIENCFTLIGAQLKTHDIAVVLDLDAGAAVVRGDANELEQVFLNLITNARDVLEGRPEPRLTIRSRQDGGRVTLEFRDNGPGVPAAIADRIFDPFFTTKEVGRGTGLGLSISHGIVEKHGGTLEARSDGGAVFTITLPAAERTAQTTPLALPRAA